jgi:hypothetical protein
MGNGARFDGARPVEDIDDVEGEDVEDAEPALGPPR